jgi:hypothetical protein
MAAASCLGRAAQNPAYRPSDPFLPDNLTPEATPDGRLYWGRVTARQKLCARVGSSALHCSLYVLWMINIVWHGAAATLGI